MIRTSLILLAVVFHSVPTIGSWTEHGYLAVFPPFSESCTTQIFSDLFVALTLINIWVYSDLKRLGKPIGWFALHVLGTILSGSYAPLTYLLVRERLKGPAVDS
jgi:hypothetical protein